MLRKIRIAVAVLVLTCITLLFLDFTGTLHPYLGWLAKIQFLPALLAVNVVVVGILILITLLFGRIYCSVICPLGIMQDVFAWFGKKTKRNRYHYSRAHSALRYVILGLFIVALIAGIHLPVALLAPYSAYGRIVTHLLAPVYGWINNLLALWAEHANSYLFYETDVWLKGVSTLIVAIATLLIVGTWAWKSGRGYCNSICPVGTILGFVARFSLFKPVIDTEKCNNCKLCTRNCKAACINAEAHQIDYSRCVVCMDCLGKCHQGAISYRPVGWSASKKATIHSSAPTDESRRKFIGTGALLTVGGMVHAQQKKVDGGLATIEKKEIIKRNTPIVPAGAGSLRHFTQHCTACQLCVAECPNGVLRPSSDLSRLMQPEMSYERGYCRPECNRCSEVCPAGAIRPISVEEKSSTQIGHAVWVKENCVVLTDGVKCGNCARHCPTEAIQMVASVAGDDKSPQIPVVDTEKCIGCGACENLCPARPFSAIYVEGHLMHKTV